MREFNFFWGRFLLFKNFKPIILSFYILLSGLGYLFRKDIYEIWFTGLSKCFIVEGEGLSLFFTLYYFYFTSSSIFILYSPLLLLDKKYRNNGKFVLANMTDTMFMCHPDWNEKTYAFVYLDGPHMTKDVITEAVWFANRSAPHSRIVIDDTDKMETSVIAHVLTYFDFKTIEMGDTKICLEKK